MTKHAFAILTAVERECLKLTVRVHTLRRVGLSQAKR